MQTEWQQGILGMQSRGTLTAAQRGRRGNKDWMKEWAGAEKLMTRGEKKLQNHRLPKSQGDVKSDSGWGRSWGRGVYAWILEEEVVGRNIMTSALVTVSCHVLSPWKTCHGSEVGNKVYVHDFFMCVIGSVDLSLYWLCDLNVPHWNIL